MTWRIHPVNARRHRWRVADESNRRDSTARGEVANDELMFWLYRSFVEITEVTSGKHLIVIDQFVSLDIGRQPEPFIDRPEILVAISQELLETVDYKIGLLKVVDHIF